MSDEPILEFDYQLKTTIDYSSAGQLEHAQFIRLTPPSSKNVNDCAFLYQSFMAATKDANNNAETKTKTEKEKAKTVEDLDGQSLIMMFAMSEKVKLDAVLLTAVKVLTNGCATVDGSEKLTKPLVDKMTFDDLTSMVGEFLVNFILASALRKMKEI